MTKFKVPEPNVGYNIERGVRSFFSLIVPTGDDIKNLIKNPSVETNSTSWYDVNANLTSMTRVTTQQRRGLFSMEVVTQAVGVGGVAQDVAVVAGTVYAFSIDFLSKNRQTFVLQAGTTVLLTFRATGQWQRLYGFFRATSTGNVAFSVQTATAAVATFYTDGWMVHAGARRETYIDGDQIGFLPNRTDYYWLGLAHGSQSIRIGQSRHGGEIVNLADYGLKVAAIVGLGLPPLDHSTLPRLTGGSAYQRTTPRDRQFTLGLRLQAESLAELQRLQRQFTEDIVSTVVRPDQPFMFHFQLLDECDAEKSDVLEIPAVYDTGFEGLVSNDYDDRFGAQFRLFLPYVGTLVGEHGKSFSAYTVTTVHQATRRLLADGFWKAMGNGFNNKVRQVKFNHIDGRLYFGGDFTNNGPLTQPMTYVSAWSRQDETWDTLSGGTPPTVPAVGLGIRANGDVYAGLSNNTYLIYDRAAGTWGAGVGVFNGQILDFAWGPDGRLYACGTFTTIGALTVNRIAVFDYNSGTWAALGTGLNGTATSVEVDSNGIVYVFGDFTTAGGNAALRAAFWNGTVWAAMGAGFDAVVEDAVITDSGHIVAVGAFTVSGAVSMKGVAEWNGSAWLPLSTGLASTGPTVIGYRIAKNPVNGHLLIAGDFETAGGVVSLGMAEWTGDTFVPPDNGESVTGVYYVPAYDDVGNLYAGLFTTSFNSTVLTATPLDLVYDGTAPAWPVLTIRGPSGSGPSTGDFRYLENVTTGARVFLDRDVLQVAPGEVIRITFDPEKISIVSNHRGDILNALLPGGDASRFFLIPGDNRLVFVFQTATPTTSIVWRDNHASIAGIVR